jgi:hypothetical protein
VGKPGSSRRFRLPKISVALAYVGIVVVWFGIAVGFVLLRRDEDSAGIAVFLAAASVGVAFQFLAWAVTTSDAARLNSELHDLRQQEINVRLDLLAALAEEQRDEQRESNRLLRALADGDSRRPD